MSGNPLNSLGRALRFGLLALLLAALQASAADLQKLSAWPPAAGREPALEQALLRQLSASRWCDGGQLQALLQDRSVQLFRLEAPASATGPSLLVDEDPIVELFALAYRDDRGCARLKVGGRTQPNPPGSLISPWAHHDLQGREAASPLLVLIQDAKAVRAWVELMPREEFQRRTGQHWMAMAGFVGMLLLIPFLSLQLGVMGEGRLSLAYAFYVATLLFWSLQNFGLGQQWLSFWPASAWFPELHGLSVSLLTLGIGVATLAALQLRGRERLALAVPVAAVALLFGVAYKFEGLYRYSALALVLLAGAVISMLLRRLRARHSVDPWFLAGLGANMLGGGIQSLTIVLPDTALRGFGGYAFAVGNLVHAMAWVTAVQRRHARDREAQRLQLEFDATHDPVTRLPNRQWLDGRLQQSIDEIASAPLLSHGGLFVDLDRFKQINDTLGHSKGDELLCLLSARLADLFGDHGTVTRFGGDEYFVVVHEACGEAELALLGSDVLRRLQEPILLDGRTLRISASIGMVVIGEQYRIPEDVIRDADLALHRAKHRGRARFEIFEPAMRKAADERFRIESDMRGAIERQEFKPFFQPIIQLEGMSHAGFEALVRWEHGKQGFIGPGDFIPVAEENGLICEIGLQVMEGSMRQVAEWRRAGLWREGWYVSVNVSGVQLRDANLVERFAELRSLLGLRSGDIRIEVTESSVIANQDVAFGLLPRLKEQGFLLCMDDFGTGYSSLSYLSELPFDVLKIDRSFITDLCKRRELSALVTTVINLADTMGMLVVAEGIEEKDQCEALHGLHCGYGQGYLFSRPMNAEQATRWLEAASARSHPAAA
ncbi:EAL domain-containing protein [Pelomonas sp. SE-A7]|uniref:putative bifunctional diguanylate cyclase/phosphodiesterase n=1 Tax=Pelomonas sp. SE-A7 TaxID=3054953 RepID=UPI00259D067E|nr:EAL domain-containing protein [Pelomonas sp. SE-A7]MDM4768073.1 EAL domain-containing protein [Pelomonas sp. SE-A7]